MVRLGFEPDETQPHKAEGRHNLDKPVTENGAGSDGSDGNKSRIRTEADEAALWQDRDYDRDADTRDTPAQQQEDNPWDSANTGNGQS